jgi:protoporphyrinogen/coproporphyrinogen III oxidase
MSTPSPRILVIGGGITGLCCAHRLAALGLDPLLVEASPRVGGRIRTLHEDGFEFEAGPNTLLNNSEALNSLLDELALRPEVITASPSAKKRLVLLRGQLHPLPTGPISALTSPLLGPSGVLGVLGDLVRPRPAGTPDDESVASFVRRRFGSRVLDNLVGPFLSGVYAGDPEQLEVRSVLPMLVEAEKARGSVIRGFIHRRRQARKTGKKASSPQGITFRGGLERLPARLAETLASRIRTGTAVDSLRLGSSDCEVTLQSGEVLTVDRVVIATETSVAAKLVRALPGGVDVAMDLLAIPSSDVAVVGLAYPRTQVRHPLDGFGYLVGPGNTGPMLGCLFRSSIFPASAPDGSVLLTCFLGGALHDIRREPDDRLVQIAREEMSRRVGAQGRPSKVFCIRWNQALPQANRGHARRRERIESWARQGRVSIISSGVYGAPLPKCIETGRAEAQRLASIQSPVAISSEDQICVPA